MSGVCAEYYRPEEIIKMKQGVLVAVPKAIPKGSF
jgi:hypothetical protein